MTSQSAHGDPVYHQKTNNVSMNWTMDHGRRWAHLTWMARCVHRLPGDQEPDTRKKASWRGQCDGLGDVLLGNLACTYM